MKISDRTAHTIAFTAIASLLLYLSGVVTVPLFDALNLSPQLKNIAYRVASLPVTALFFCLLHWYYEDKYAADSK
jgi:p-aminobenzoyl-glutamate transporter AbgT